MYAILARNETDDQHYDKNIEMEQPDTELPPETELPLEVTAADESPLPILHRHLLVVNVLDNENQALIF